MDKPKQSREGKSPSLPRSKQREHFLTLSRDLHDREQEARRLENAKKWAHRRGSQSRQDEGWLLLRTGETEKALTLLKNLSGETDGRDARDSLGYGAALMWTGHYDAAIKHFELIIQVSEATKNPMMRFEDHYALCGAGYWCIGDRNGALKFWRKGFKAPYASYRVGSLECPMLVLVASILGSEFSDRAKVLELLKRRSSNPYVTRYPGTLSQFFVGSLDSEALQASLECGAREPLRSIRDRKFKADFYRAVLELGQSHMTRAEFKEHMRFIAEPFRFHNLEAGEFWWLTRSAEYYLATHEARS